MITAPRQVRPIVLTAVAAAALVVPGCDWMPGKPKPDSVWQPPTAEVDFTQLYGQNCRGCHGDGETVGPSISMNNPLYLAVIPETTLREVIANGIEGTAMPGFAASNGGPLTDEQITILVNGIRQWGQPPPAGPLPPYSGPLGNPQAGASAFGVFCASCHGTDGTGLAGKAGSVVNPAFLGLVSDQYLRTIVIAGRNDLGCPDFRSRVSNRAMTDAEISDVVAWLASQRRDEFGQPLAADQR